MKQFIVCFCAAFLCVCNAKAEVYKKIDPTTGHITLTNIPPRSLQQNQESTPPVVMPMPAKSAAPVHAQPSPASFPKLSPDLQKERDKDRKQILENELKTEQTALKEATDKKAPADVVSRHKANIAALEREILNVK